MAAGDKRIAANSEPEIELADGSWVTDWQSLNVSGQSFADADTPYVWAIPNASSVEAVSFVLGDRRAGQEDRRSALLSFTPAQLKETAAPWTHTVEGDQDVLSAIDVPQFYNWTIKSRVIAGDVLELTFNSVHRDNAAPASPDLGVDTFGGLFSLSVRYASAPVLSSVTTARYQPNHDYLAGAPILEPNPADDFAPYTWTADADFTSGPDPDFDGTGFTPQAKAPTIIGTEIDILNSNGEIKSFAGRSIAKASDIQSDVDAVIRKFRPALATQLYGRGNGQILHAIDGTNGRVYEVREGQTVTSDAQPSSNGAEWRLHGARVLPRISLADLQARPFPELVNLTGESYWLVDTQEQVVWDVNATPANVAPRKTYLADQTAPPVENTAGRWVVTSPGPVAPAAAQFDVFTGAETEPSLHAPNLLRDDIRFLIARGALPNYDGSPTNNYGTDANRQRYTFAGGQVYEAIVAAVDPLADPSGTSAGLKALRDANWRQVSGVLYLNTTSQSIPDGNFNTYVSAADRPKLEPGDTIEFNVSVGAFYYVLTAVYVNENQVHEMFGDAAHIWRASFSGGNINLKAQAGTGTQRVESIKITR